MAQMELSSCCHHAAGTWAQATVDSAVATVVVGMNQHLNLVTVVTVVACLQSLACHQRATRNDGRYSDFRLNYFIQL